MKGLIGKKVGMTSVFDAEGKNIACTVIEAGPCTVTQVKTMDTDGYEAIQVGFDPKKEKNASKAIKGHFAKGNSGLKKKVMEFRDFDDAKIVGEALTVEMFAEGETVDVIGTSKGKGFQGVVKRHGFKGVGMRTHGQHDRLRAPGSLGASSFPSKVIKGMRMAGRMGGDKKKVTNLKIVKIFADRNLLVVNGPVPGAKGSYVIIEK